MRTALLAGATGLVGGHLLRHLLADDTWDRVVSVGRREVDVRHDKLEQRRHHARRIARPAARGRRLLRAGHHHQEGRQPGGVPRRSTTTRWSRWPRPRSRPVPQSFLHVTAMGAERRARGCSTTGSRARPSGTWRRSGIPATVAFRPSIIDGDRAESRPGEQAGLVVMRALAPVLGRFRPTRAEDVALGDAAPGQGAAGRDLDGVGRGDHPLGVDQRLTLAVTRSALDLGAPAAADIVSLRVWTVSGRPRTCTTTPNEASLTWRTSSPRSSATGRTTLRTSATRP